MGIDEGLREKVKSLAVSRIRQSIGTAEKQERSDFLADLEADILEQVIDPNDNEEVVMAVAQDTGSILKDLEKQALCAVTLGTGLDADIERSLAGMNLQYVPLP